MNSTAYLNTARWLIRDQRQLIRDGFDEAEHFQIELMLPLYNSKHLRKKLSLRKRRVIFVCSPQIFAEVYKAPHEAINPSSAYAFLKPYFGDESVFVSEGDSHIPAKQSVYRLIKDDMEIQADDYLFFQYSVREAFRDGEQAILPIVQKITSAFVIRTIFGEQGTRFADKIVQETINAAGNASTILLVLPGLLRWTRRFGVGLSVRRQRLVLRNFILDQLKGLDIADDWNGPRNRAAPAPRTEIVDNLMTLLIAGFETTATTISWLLYELARSSDIQANLRSEIVSRLHSDGIAYFEDDSSLLALCVHETLRLHPSIPFIIREAVNDGSYHGIEVRSGDYIVLSIEELQKRHFGDSGAEFRPERFATKVAKSQYPKISTFGGGAKICPGRAVATQKIRIITALILASYHLETCTQTDPRITRNRVSATPRNGMVLKLRRVM